MMMKSAKVVDYDFIPENKDLLQNEGFCAMDNFVGTYAPHIKKLTRDYFIGLCYEVRGEVNPFRECKNMTVEEKIKVNVKKISVYKNTSYNQRS